MPQCISLPLSKGWRLKKELAGTLVALGDVSFQISMGFAQKGEMNVFCYSLVALEKCPESQSQLNIFGESGSQRIKCLGSRFCSFWFCLMRFNEIGGSSKRKSCGNSTFHLKSSETKTMLLLTCFHWKQTSCKAATNA